MDFARLFVTLPSKMAKILRLGKKKKRVSLFCSQLFVTLHADMRMNTGYNREGEYDHYVVEQGGPLLDWLLENLGQSRSKVKATLQGRGIKVNGKTVSQFDFPLEPGMKVAVSRTKRNQKGFKSRWVRIVYEDRWLIVVEKAEGILSMAGGHAALNVKAVLDDYFKNP